MLHLRIERADDEGHKRVVKYDHLYVVDDDEREIDISRMVRGWSLNAKANEAEVVTLYLMGVRIIENPAHLPKQEG